MKGDIVYIVTLLSILLLPTISFATDFVPPTPDNNTATLYSSIPINFSYNETSYPLAKFIFDWNGSNYTLYDDSLKLMYNFDHIAALGEDDTHVTDMSIYGNNATCSTNCPYWDSNGKYDGDLYFDGFSSFSSFYTPLDIQPSAMPNMTFVAWVNPNYNGIVFSDDNGGNDRGLAYTYSGGDVWEVYTGDTAPGYQDVAPVDFDWQQVAVVYTPTTVTFYKNGVSYGSFPVSGQSSTNNLTLGKDPIDAYSAITARIDEVRVYNRSLDDSEIKELYDSNLNKYDTGKWLYFTNQPFGTLPTGQYNFTYYGCSIDSSSYENCTETRQITYNIPPCPVIDAGETYVQSENLTGAANDASEISPGGRACVKIAASDVVYDCNGYNISNVGIAGPTYGILVNGSVTNVTIKNCPNIDSYTYGIYMSGAENSTIMNNSAYGGTDGFHFNGSYTNLTITENYVQSSANGFYFGNATLSNSTFANNSVGFMTSYGLDFNNGSVEYSTIANNTFGISGIDGWNGFYFYGNFSNNTVDNNVVNSYSTALQIYSETELMDNNFTNNYVSTDASATGFSFSSNSGDFTDNLFMNNTANGSAYGFSLSGGLNNIVKDNLANNCSYEGFNLNSLPYLTFTNNTALFEGSGAYTSGFYFSDLFGANITNNTAINGGYGYQFSLSHSVFDNNTAQNNYDGFFGFGSISSNITNNTAINSVDTGFYAYGDDQVLYQGNNASNGGTGFYMEAPSGNNTLTLNVAQNNTGIGFNLTMPGYYQNITNNTALDNLNGGFLMDITYSTFLNNTAINSTIGLSVSDGGNTIANNTLKENSIYDLDPFSHCGNYILNNTGSGDRPIIYSQYPTSLSSVTASEIIICGTSPVTLDHVTVSGSDTLNNNGLFILNSNNVNISYPVSNDNLYGIFLNSSSGINLTNGTFNNNQYDGISIQDDNGSIIVNDTAQENGHYDVYMTASTDVQCNNNVSRIIASADKPIAYYNTTVHLSGPGDNGNAEIILCNADYSTIDGVTVSGSTTLNNDGFLFIRTDFSNITNSVSSDNYNGFSFMSSNHNNISGDTANDNAMDGFMLWRSNYNILSGYTATGNGDLPLNITESYGNSFGVIYTLSDCANLTEPGLYQLTSDVLFTRTNDSAPAICFNINASNVILDCQGHNVNFTGNDSSYPFSTGIDVRTDDYLNPTSGVSVLNCNISNFTKGIISSADYSSFDGNTMDAVNWRNYGNGLAATGSGLVVTNNRAYHFNAGFYIITNGPSSLVGNNIANNDNYGFHLNVYDGALVSGNSAANDGNAFEIYGSGSYVDYNYADNCDYGFDIFGYQLDIGSNTAHNTSHSGSSGFNLGVDYSNVTDNVGTYNRIGLTLTGIDNHIFSNEMYNNSEEGISVATGSYDNTINLNNLQGNGWYDLFVDTLACSNNIYFNTGSGNLPINFSNTAVHWTNVAGMSEIILCNADDSVLQNVTVNTTGHNGILMQDTSNAVINFSQSSGNYNGIYIHKGGSNNVTNSIFNNNYNGISVTQSYNNYFFNDTTDGNGNGIVITLSYGNTFWNATSQNNTMYDLFIHPGSDKYGSPCDNTIHPINATGGKPILFINLDGSVLRDNDTYSEIMLCGVHDVILDNVTVSGSTANIHNSGILVVNSNDSLINRSNSSNNYAGIYLINSQRNNITNNTCNSNVLGIRADVSDDNLIADNTANSNSDVGILSPGFYFSDPNHGYYLFVLNNIYPDLYMPYGDTSYRNDISNNTVTSNANSGIFFSNTQGSTIHSNHVTSNGQYGVFVDYFQYGTIANNTIINNGWDGIRYAGRGGDYYSNVTNNLITGNNYGIWQTDAGMINYTDNNASSNRLDGTRLEGGGCHDNYFANNAFNYNGWNGFVLISWPSYNTIINDSAWNNAGDGFVFYYAGGYNTLEYSITNNNSNNGVKIEGWNGNNDVLSYNNASNNSNDGFLIQYSPYNNSLDHDLSRTNGNNGFEMLYAGDNNSISYCNSTSNTWQGIWLWVSNNSEIDNNNASSNKNGVGIGLYASANDSIHDNYIYNSSNSDGILIGYSSNNNSVYSNTVIKNLYGISVYSGSYGNRITYNNVSNTSSDRPLSVGASSYNNTVSFNNVFNNSNRGIVIWDHSTNNTVFNNTVFGNPNYGIRVEGSSTNNLIEWNTVYNISYAAFNVDNSINNTLLNNYAANSSRGYYLSGGSNYTNLTGNTAFNTTVASGTGVGFISDPNTIFITLDSNIQNITTRPTYGLYGYGYYLSSGCSYAVITNNTAESNNYGAFYVAGNYTNLTNNRVIFIDGVDSHLLSGPAQYYLVSNGSILLNNTANGFGDLFHIIGLNNTLINNTASNMNTGMGFTIAGYNNTLIGNNATGAGAGYTPDAYRILGGGQNLLANNTAYYVRYGFQVLTSNYNNLIGNNATIISDIGFVIQTSNHTTFINNTAYNSTNNGFEVDSSSYSTSMYNAFSGNNATMVSNSGFYEFGASDNYTDNIAYNDTYGIYVFSSLDDSFVNNSIYSNAYGVLVLNSDYFGIISSRLNFSRNTFDSNSLYGLFLNNSYNDSLEGDRFFNNTYDFRASNYSKLNISYVVFDNPLGTMENFTNLSLNDTGADTGFFINWTANESAPPYPSFRQKFVNISAISGPIIIDHVVWGWSSDELLGYDESRLQLWKYNSTGWIMLNDTPNMASHTLSFTNLNPNGDFGILQGEAVNCPVITTSGTFTQNNNYTGAPNDASEMYYAGTACVKIAASDVIFDCNHYSITNNGTGGYTYGVLLNGSLTNVTVQNCDVSNYTYGIYQYNSANSSILNNSAHNNSETGIHLQGIGDISSDGNTIYNNNVTGNGQGIYVVFSDQNNISNNIAENDGSGIGLYLSDQNIISNNILDNNTYDGLAVNVVAGNNLYNNSADNNGGYGIFFYYSDQNALSDNDVGNNGWGGMALFASTQFTLINNTVYNNSGEGILLESAQITLINNTVYNNSGAGFMMSNADEIVVQGMHLFNNNPDVLAANSILNLSDLIIDNPLGSFENYTNLSINDSLDYDETYTINWTANESVPPYPSFRQKFVNITTISGAVSIDSIVWSWLDSDVPGYTEGLLQLWEYNSTGWTRLNNSPNTVSHTLSLGNMNPDGDYGILQGSENCPVITTSGTFIQHINYTGAPNNASPFISNTACVVIASSDVVFDCAGYNITNNGTGGTTYGILLNGSLTNVTVENCNVSSYTYGIYEYQSNDSLILNNSAHDNSHGIELYNSSQTNLSGNSVQNNYIGVYLDSSSDNNMSDNIVDYNSLHGIEFSSSDRNNISGNHADGNTQYGIDLEVSDQNTLYNNSFDNNSDAGIALTSSNNNTLSDNSADSNQNGGIYIFSSDNNTLADNSFDNNTDTGIFLASSNSSTFSGNSARNNSNAGLLIIDSDQAVVQGQYFSNNNPDVLVIDGVGPLSLNLSDVIFDNPLGTMEHFTNLSLNDTVESGESYSINWTGQEADLPNGTFSFRQKFVNITTISGPVSIDSIVWSWLDSERTGYNESAFQLWEYNSTGWTMLNDTPDTVSHALSLMDMNPSGDYGILQGQQNCPVISDSGTFVQIMNYTGAPNDASEMYGGAMACVKITASNVVFDCDGFNISNDGTSGATYGIAVTPSLTNVTIQNCPGISSYTIGIGMVSTTNSTITNSTVLDCSVSVPIWASGINLIGGSNINITNNTFSGDFWGIQFGASSDNLISGNVVNGSSDIGIRLWGWNDNNTIINNTVYGNGADGIGIGTISNSNQVINNTVYGNTYGIYITDNSNNNTVSGNTAYGNTNGFYVGDNSPSTGTNFTNNTAYGNSNSGIELFGSDNNTVSDNIAYGNSYAGIELSSSNNNTVSDNAAFDNSAFGILLVTASSDNLVSDNAAYGNSVDGIDAWDRANNNLFINNTLYDNANNNYVAGFELGGNSYFNQVINNTAYNNNGDGFHLEQDASNNTVSGNIAYNNSGNGIYLWDNGAGNDYNNITNNSVYNNTAYGIYLAGDEYNNVTNNSVYDNTGSGIVLGSSGYNNVTDNTVHNNNRGIELGYSDNNLLSDNLVYDNNEAGFFIGTDSYNVISDNVVYGNTGNGMFIWWGSSYNTVINNTVHNNGDLGIGFGTSSNYNQIINNTCYNNNNAFYLIDSANNNNITGNIAYGNHNGFLLTSGGYYGPENYNNVTNNTAYGNDNGFYMDWTNYNNLTDNIATGNVNNGLVLHNADQTLVDGIYFSNNTEDLLVDNDVNYWFTISLSNAIFDNPLGTMENYTNLSLNDTVANGEQYDIRWAANETPTPLRSFRQKFVDINDLRSAVYIDSIVWTWLPSELPTYDESNLQVFNYYSSVWTDENAVLDMVSHTLTLTNLDEPYGQYGILQLVYCPVITESGSYMQFTDFYGAPNDASEMPEPGMACVKIAASDVTYDCNGHSITDNGTAGTSYAVLINDSLTGVVLKNCNVSQYTYGMYDYKSTGSLFQNNTAFSNLGAGMAIHNSNPTVEYSHLYDNGRDLLVWDDSGSSISFQLTGTVFDNPLGDYHKYTNLSITDSVDDGSTYSISWEALPEPVPKDHVSFEQKFVNITAIAGNLSIDSIAWNWQVTELDGYNESNFELWNYTVIGWTNASGTLDVGAHTLSLIPLTQQGGYGIMEAAPAIHLVPFEINYTNLPRWGGMRPGDLSLMAGNLTPLDLSSTQLTDHWAGIYGNITGAIVLRDNGSIVYMWLWNPDSGSVVCASTNSTMFDPIIMGAKGSDIDVAWNVLRGSDMGNETFTGTGCSLTFGTVTIGNANYADTGPPGGFVTCAFKLKPSPLPVKNQMLFCSQVESNGTFWNGETGNFELMVPTQAGPTETETYFMYMSIN